MADRPAVAVAALSARALAQAARRAGFPVLAFDLFGDRDTRAAARHARLLPGALDTGFEPAALLDAVKSAAPDVAGLVYGAGFEDRPGLLAEIAAVVPLLGNAPATVRRVKDPRVFFPALARLGIAFPEVRLERPPEGTDWLVKRIGGSGGGHVGAEHQDSGCYYQRRADGRPVSALFLADGRGARLVGLSEQWAAPSARGGEFRYGGAVQPAEVSHAVHADIAAVLDALVPAFGLEGLNSADFLVGEPGCDLLEINPRPGATLDLFDSGALFAQHCAACQGALPPSRGPSPARAAAVIYAPRAIRIPARVDWPLWAADLPHGEETIARDAPLCSVLADAPTPAAARALVMSRRAEILTRLTGPAVREAGP